MAMMTKRIREEAHAHGFVIMETQYVPHHPGRDRAKTGWTVKLLKGERQIAIAADNGHEVLAQLRKEARNA